MHLLAKQLLTCQLISYLGEPKVAIIKIRVKLFVLFPPPLYSIMNESSYRMQWSQSLLDAYIFLQALHGDKDRAP